MPRIFFDMHDGREVRDDKGTDVSGPDETRARAVQMVGEYVQRPNSFSTEGGAVTVDARDGDGNHILTARAVLSVDGR